MPSPPCRSTTTGHIADQSTYAPCPFLNTAKSASKIEYLYCGVLVAAFLVTRGTRHTHAFYISGSVERTPCLVLSNGLRMPACAAWSHERIPAGQARAKSPCDAYAQLCEKRLRINAFSRGHGRECEVLLEHLFHPLEVLQVLESSCRPDTSS